MEHSILEKNSSTANSAFCNPSTVYFLSKSVMIVRKNIVKIIKIIALTDAQDDDDDDGGGGGGGDDDGAGATEDGYKNYRL
ncbi:hypothetical protein PVL30_004031 [Lodderomyces elongisporus]|uniref:uncharacterized protein n=1 Tax=Lodderomyces elongisporus TaxID=36914 RepID=UPI00291EBADC|nr:uncharacterized protein PVL30_004031 [Lodderomyces elongisporus]WLF80255.1 hypothetical protein PVL30_004031 [Lodderomyces elongisporus]